MSAALVLSAILAAAPTTEDRGQALARWYQGPVRYLLTRREEKAYRGLHDDSSRSEFIRLFWRKRDPISSTAENEARISFWRRVVEANRLFQDSSLPGWKTDRGKIYILAGPPTDIQEDPNFDVGDVNIAGTGLIRWIYEGGLNIRSIGGTFVVPFVRGNDGGYHLSSSARLSSPSFDPLNSYDRASSYIAKIQSSLDYGPSDLGVALDQGLLQTPPWNEKDFIDRVTSEAYLGALPMQVSFDFLRASDGTTFALINCAVPFSAFKGDTISAPVRPDLSVVARLSPVAGGEALDVGESEFSPAPSSLAQGLLDVLLYQARVPLRPGGYDLYIGVFDRVQLRAGNLRSTIEIPDLNGPLTLSSIALGRSIRPLPEGAGGYNRPFRISDFEFIPAVNGVFRNGQTFAAFWQVYTEGPSGSGSGLGVSTQFFKTTEEGEQALGEPRIVEDAEAVQGYSLELQGWPAGSYWFKVSVTDRKGRTASRSVGFKLQ